MIDCNADLLNTSKPGCDQRVGVTIGLMIVPPGFEYTNEAALLALTNTTAILNAAVDSRGFVINPGLPYLLPLEPTNDDPVLTDGLNGVRIFNRDGNRRLKFNYTNMPECWKKNVRSYVGKNWEAFLITAFNYVRGYTPDGTKIRGFSARIHPGNTQFAGDGDTPEGFDLHIDFSDPNQIGSKGVAVLATETTGDFFAIDLDGIVNCNLSEVSTTGETAVTVDVKTDCGNSGVPNLVLADFLVLDSGGTPVVPSDVSEDANTPGRYVITATLTAGTYTVALAGQPTMTTKYFESLAALSFTTSA